MMGRRSNFPKQDRNYYRTTDPQAVAPLLKFLLPGTKYYEPCAGDGALIKQLDGAGHVCVGAGDIQPMAPAGFSPVIHQKDALQFKRRPGASYYDYTIITNPPWDRPILHDLIHHWIEEHPCWLLFDAGWPYSLQAAGKRPVAGERHDLMRHCAMIVAVGRVRWFEGTTMKHSQDSAWYYFTRRIVGAAKFFGR